MLAGTLPAFALTSSCAAVIGESYRFRVVVEVIVDGQLRLGSSVQRYVYRDAWKPLKSMSTTHTNSYGEGFAVDLGSRGLLVVTLRSWGRERLSSGQREMRDDWTPDKVSYATVPLAQRKEGRVWQGWPTHRVLALRPDDLPVMVTFGDRLDPLSVRLVNPADLEKTFGAGVVLRKAYVETTWRPQTRGKLKRTLPWLPTLEQQNVRLDGGSSWRAAALNRVANDLSSRDFIRTK